MLSDVSNVATERIEERFMNDQNFTTTFSVSQTREEVFGAINNVRGWWSQAIEGDTGKLGAVFYYHYQDVHRCTFKITEFVPGKKVVWHVLHNYLSLKLPRRVTKQKFALRTLGSCLHMSATVFARTHGART